MQTRAPSTLLVHQYQGAGAPLAAVPASSRRRMGKRLIDMKNFLAKKRRVNVLYVYTVSGWPLSGANIPRLGRAG